MKIVQTDRILESVNLGALLTETGDDELWYSKAEWLIDLLTKMINPQASILFMNSMKPELSRRATIITLRSLCEFFYLLNTNTFNLS